MAAPSPADDRSQLIDEWRRGVEEWLVPEAVQQRGPEPNATLEPERFRWRPDDDARQPVRPSRRRALEALPEGGSVLDVGVGGGASSLGLVPRAAHITGVDVLQDMLESFEASARAVGVGSRSVLGRWPEVAGQVEPADIAVCHHAIYGVAEIEPFVAAITGAARHRVVLEVSASLPLTSLNPLWRRFHGIERRDRPVADEAEALLASMGLAVAREDLVLPAAPQPATPERVAFIRRRLFVGPDRDAEIAEFLEGVVPQDHRVAALWWPGAAA